MCAFRLGERVRGSGFPARPRYRRLVGGLEGRLVFRRRLREQPIPRAQHLLPEGLVVLGSAMVMDRSPSSFPVQRLSHANTRDIVATLSVPLWRANVDWFSLHMLSRNRPMSQL